MKCDASHYGLTIAEMQKWEQLQGQVEYRASVVSRTKNEETDEDFDKAIDLLLAFEKKHKIIK